MCYLSLCSFQVARAGERWFNDNDERFIGRNCRSIGGETLVEWLGAEADLVTPRRKPRRMARTFTRLRKSATLIRMIVGRDERPTLKWRGPSEPPMLSRLWWDQVARNARLDQDNYEDQTRVWWPIGRLSILEHGSAFVRYLQNSEITLRDLRNNISLQSDARGHVFQQINARRALSAPR